MFTVWILLILGVSSYPKHVDTTNDHGGSTNSSIEGSRRFASPHQKNEKQLITRSRDPWIDCNWISMGLGNNFIATNNQDDLAGIQEKCEKLKADRKKKETREKKYPVEPDEDETSTEEISYPEYVNTDEHVGSLYKRPKREMNFPPDFAAYMAVNHTERQAAGYNVFDCAWGTESNSVYTHRIYKTGENLTKFAKDTCKWSDTDIERWIKDDKIVPELYKKHKTKNTYYPIYVRCPTIEGYPRNIFVGFRDSEENYKRWCEPEPPSTTESSPTTTDIYTTTEKSSPPGQHSSSIHDIYLSGSHNDYRLNPTGNTYMPGSENFLYANQVIHNYEEAKNTTRYYGLMGQFGHRQKYNAKKSPYSGGSAQHSPKKELLWG